MWGTIIGAGISAAGSLLGGLFGDDEETETTVDYKAMAKAARAAGFNPLTVLRNGGSAGFTTTTHPALSAWSGVGSAMQTIGNAVAAYDPRSEATAELEYKIKQAQLQSIQSSNAVLNARQLMSLGGVPSSLAPTRVGAGGVPVPASVPMTSKQAAALAIGTQPKAGETTVTNPLYGGLEVNPWVKDAASFTDRYGEGEVAETLLLLHNAGADIGWNVYKSGLWKEPAPAAIGAGFGAWGKWRQAGGLGGMQKRWRSDAAKAWGTQPDPFAAWGY